MTIQVRKSDSLRAGRYRAAAENNRFSKKNGNKDAIDWGRKILEYRTVKHGTFALKNKTFISQHSNRSKMKHVRHDRIMVERIYE